MNAIENADLILIVAVLAGLLLLGLLYGLRQYHVANRELKAGLEAARQTEFELRDLLHESEKNVQALQLNLVKERELVEQKIEQFDANRKQLKLEFEHLANRVLEEKTRVFDKTNKDSLESLLRPFREQVEGFQKRINDVHSESIKGNAALEGEIKKVLEVGLKIGSDAKNLTDALKGDSQRRGSWGETQLEKTLQMAGLVEHDHYEKQSAMQDAEGRRKQTDFLIKLPDNKHIVIDSKVSLAAYDRAVAAETDQQFELALAEHVRAVKRHIDDLQGKDYTNLVGIRSPSFVLMFMPIEPAYIEALKYERDLFSYGYDRGIVMVSHTTLIPILRTVANLWSMERSTREARELGDKAGDIYNQVRKVAERLARIGGSLGAATNHYNETVRALSGRQGLRGKVERFAEMSSKVTKSIPEIEPLHSDLQSESLDLLAEPLEPEIEPEKTGEKVRAS
ncbi:MAG: DNA recombination protein RmuC [Gammaproteobacteria bacterium]|nr:DNA recombination protein RmuC [Gammaproteobacteria bacterium]MDH3448067.1 DNA recombination protein RmuC [Gammaproteobacteria bacterium]